MARDSGAQAKPEQIAVPILSCSESVAFENDFFSNNSLSEWDAMHLAGAGVGREILNDFLEIQSECSKLKVLLLVGKGHNGGDAILALSEMIRLGSEVEIQYDLVLSSTADQLRENTKQVLLELTQRLSHSRIWCPDHEENIEDFLASQDYDLSIDGLLGMQFKAPLKGVLSKIIEVVNSHESILFRASVDLPSGMGDESDVCPMKADCTYTTGIVKQPLLDRRYKDYVGRIRFVDIGFFNQKNVLPFLNHCQVTTQKVLSPLKKLRKASSDKRSFGRVVLLGGSLNMSGAIFMATQSALRAGAGLVRTYLPQGLVSYFSAALPEAMWRGCQTDEQGWISERDTDSIGEEINAFADVLVVGPGIGKEVCTKLFLKKLLPKISCPIVMDADALLPELINDWEQGNWSSSGVLITPHVGEFKRLLSVSALSEDEMDDRFVTYCQEKKLVGLLKGTQSRISDGQRCFINPTGGPVLARGGSGDLLAGMIGAVIGQFSNQSLLESMLMAAYWHGYSADLLARERGQVSVRTTDLLEYYCRAIR
jgi:NAD(P)H-hydrate epimerase